MPNSAAIDVNHADNQGQRAEREGDEKMVSFKTTDRDRTLILRIADLAAFLLLPLLVCTTVFCVGYGLGAGVFFDRGGPYFAPLSGTETGSLDYFAQRVPDDFEVVLHFLPASNSRWHDAWAFTDWNKRPCVIYLNANDWTIYAKPLLHKVTPPRLPPDVISHELLHCLRGAWHPA